MQDFPTFLNNFSRLSLNAVNELSSCIANKTYLKGDILAQYDKVCRKLFYLKSGLVKLSFDGNNKEFIMRFFAENSLVTVLDSFLNQTPSAYRLVAIEPLITEYITFSQIEELCKKHHCIETAFRKFIALASTNMMNRISDMLEEDGAQRYRKFVKLHPSLMQRITLSDLSNYLGITQVSLSRIRSKR